VAKWLGHTNNGLPAVNTTAIYANFDDELLYQDFGKKKIVIRDIQQALLRNVSHKTQQRINRQSRILTPQHVYAN